MPTIGQLVWTQGVTLVDAYHALKKMNDIYNPLYTISNNEKIRIQNAVYFLNSEKLINDSKEKELIDVGNRMDQIRQDEFKRTKAEKADRDAAQKKLKIKSPLGRPNAVK